MINIPKIAKVEICKSTGNIVLYEEKTNNKFEFKDVIYYSTSNGRFVVEWENSGPSGPWSRGLTEDVIIVDID